MLQNKRRALVVILLLFVSTLFIVDQGLARHLKKDPFIGEWVLLDPDGSTTNLAIKGFGLSEKGDDILYKLNVTDDFASVCPSKGPFIGQGTGEASNLTLIADMTGTCKRDKITFPFQFVVTYNPANDTLVQTVGGLTLVYHRRGNRFEGAFHNQIKAGP